MRRINHFDDFFREFEELDNVFESLFERLRRGEYKETEGPFYYGVSVHVGPEGIPKVSHFGNIRTYPTGELTTDTREPFYDVIIDKDRNEAIVTLEMPGVEKKDIAIDATEETIEVKAETETRRYHQRIPLEMEIDPESARATYNNGVLEIKARLKEPLKEGRRIKVE